MVRTICRRQKLLRVLVSSGVVLEREPLFDQSALAHDLPVLAPIHLDALRPAAWLAELRGQGEELAGEGHFLEH